jgi:hypoxanthine phosphoribosyltransferase
METASGLGRVLFTEEKIKSRIAEMGRQISEDYSGCNPVVISVLKGAFYFVADLTRQMTIPVNVDFLAIGLYPGVTSSTGIVRITKDLDITITGRHVLMVEDVIGTGLTLGYLIQHLETRKPASLKVCTLLDNPAGRLVYIPIDYRGFEVSDVYVVGYGLDYKEEYRNLPYIAQFNKPPSN